MEAAVAVTGMGTQGADKAPRAEKDDFLIARFGALCFFLSALEFIIPKPLPFLRLGISNVPLIIAAGFFSPSAYSLLAFVKIIAQGVIGGTFFSWIFLFSAAGTAASAALMFMLKRSLKEGVSAVGLSVAGAFASNSAQLLFARTWIFGESVRAIIPLLLGSGIVAGFGVGVFAEFFARKSLWLAKTKVQAESGNFPGIRSSPQSVPRRERRRQRVFSLLRMAAGFSAILAAGFFRSPETRAAIFAIFYAALCIAGKRPRTLPALISLLAIAAFNLFPPRGAILAEIASLRIASESLRTGLSRAFFFEALIFISRWTFMPGKFQLPQFQEGRKQGKAAAFLRRISRLLAETLALFGKLNSGPDKKARDRAKGGKLSLEGAATHIDSILQRIDIESAASDKPCGK